MRIGMPNPRSRRSALGSKPLTPQEEALLIKLVNADSYVRTRLRHSSFERAVRTAHDRIKVDLKAAQTVGRLAIHPLVLRAPAPIWGQMRDIGKKLREFFEPVTDGILWLVGGLSSAKFQSRSVTDVPGDANHPLLKTLQEFIADTEAHRTAESAAFSRLSAADQAKYSAVVALLEPTDTHKAGFPLGRNALQKLLLNGSLLSQKDLGKNGGSLLDNLALLASEELADGIDRGKALSELVAEVENPIRIDQGNKGVCVAATAQIILARQHPAEYARLIAGIAGKEGKSQMAGGEWLVRMPDWAADNDGDRTTTSRLIEPALMNDGAFPGTAYDNIDDTYRVWRLPLGGGMASSGSAHINSQLEGHEYKSKGFYRWNRASRWNEVKAALERGKQPVAVGVRWNDGEGPGGHELQIDKIADGKVYYVNPWGQRETMAEQEFENHVDAAEIPA